MITKPEAVRKLKEKIQFDLGQKHNYFDGIFLNLSGLVSMSYQCLGGAEAAGERGKYSQICVAASTLQLIGSAHMYTVCRRIPTGTVQAHKQIWIDMHVKCWKERVKKRSWESIFLIVVHIVLIVNGMFYYKTCIYVIKKTVSIYTQIFLTHH